MTRLLIITGPQGSGNHVFSKCLAVHENVYGWKSLLNTYWEGHHHEPFAKYWNDPELLHEFDWAQKEHYVTSISCPFVKNKEPHIPMYEKFIKQLELELGKKVQTGQFGADMKVSLVNDGPVTIIIDSKNKE